MKYFSPGGGINNAGRKNKWGKPKGEK